MPGPRCFKERVQLGALSVVGALDERAGGEREQLGGVVEPPRACARACARSRRGGCARAARTARRRRCGGPCGVTRGRGAGSSRMPCARARRHRSMSSAKRWMRGSNGPSARSVSVCAARQAAIAQPTVRGVLGPVRLGASRAARQQRRVDERGEERAERARERVRAALDAAVGVEQARARAGRGRARAAASLRSASPMPLVSGFSSTVTSSVTRSSARLLAAPKPGLSRRSITSAPCARASSAPPSSGPVSTTIELRRRAERGQQRARARRASGAARRRRRSAVTADAMRFRGARRRVADVEGCLGAAAGGGGRVGVGEHRAQRCDGRVGVAGRVEAAGAVL